MLFNTFSQIKRNRSFLQPIFSDYVISYDYDQPSHYKKDKSSTIDNWATPQKQAASLNIGDLEEVFEIYWSRVKSFSFSLYYTF